MNKYRYAGHREKVMARDNDTCVYCGAGATVVDHVLPWSYSYDGSMENLVAACDPCNSVASNFYFSTIQEKQQYILTERLRREVGFFFPNPIPDIEVDGEQEKGKKWVREIIPCDVCGKDFRPTNRTSRFCHWTCSDRYSTKAHNSYVKTGSFPGGLLEHDVRVIFALHSLGHSQKSIGMMFDMHGSKISRTMKRGREKLGLSNS